MTRYLGKETPRVDGIAKVTGKAKYTAEFQVPHVAYGFLVLCTIAKGRITAIDASENPDPAASMARGARSGRRS